MKDDNSIALFDKIKGIGILIIILSHTTSIPGLIMNYEVGVVLKIVLTIVLCCGNILLPIFFIMSGYGFRKMPLKRCIKNQAKFILKPYMIIALLASLLHCACHFLAFRYLRGAIKETLRVFGGFLFALPSNQSVFGFDLFFCGAAWYLIALFIGWIILDAIENYIAEKFWMPAVCLVALAGYIIGLWKGMFFCISQGMIVVLFLYAGQQIKKKKYLLKDISIADIALLLILGTASCIIMLVTGKVDNIADGVWGVGFISIILDCAVGTIFLKLLLVINRLPVGFFAVMGRYSFLLFIIHSIEMTSIPWYLISFIWDGKSLGFLLQFIVRFSFIVAVSFIIRLLQLLLRKKS